MVIIRDPEILEYPFDEPYHTRKLRRNLIRSTEDVRIVQRHDAHALQPGKRTRHFIAMHGA